MARFRLRHPWWALAAGLLLAGLGTWGYRAAASRANSLSNPARARREQRPIPVRTVQATTSRVTAVVGATAVTEASEQIPIRIGSSRRIREFNPVVRTVHVHDGDFVRAGQVLFELEPTHFGDAVIQEGLALEAAKAELARAEAAIEENAKVRAGELENAVEEVRARSANVTYRKEDFERLERLHKQQNASLSERLEAASAYVEAQAELTRTRLRELRARADMVLGPLKDRRDVKRAADTVQQAGLDLALTEADLLACQLRSPSDGFVDAADAAAGQLVDASMVLARVLRLDPVHVRLDFPQERIDELFIGQPAEVVLDTFPQETFQGKVSRIPVRVDKQRRVLAVIVEVANPDYRIKVGVSGYVRVQVSRRTTTAPAASIIDLGSVAAVFVVKDGRAHIREVKTGPILQPGYVEVVEGLEGGDEVVIYGQQYLQDNDVVDTNWRRWARRD